MSLLKLVPSASFSIRERRKRGNNYHCNQLSLIFLLQSLGFVINLKKSILQPVKQLKFLGLQINTEEMTLFFSEEKLAYIIQQCQEVSILTSQKISQI